MTKRAVAVGAILVFSRTPLFALLAVDCTVLVNLLLHAAKKPFTAKHEQAAETFFLCIQFVVCTSLIVLCIQLYIYPDIAISSQTIVHDWTSALGVGSIVVGFCVMIAVVAKDQ